MMDRPKEVHMSDSYSEIIDAVRAIQDDPDLTNSFITILKMGSSSQQIRVSKLMDELNKREAPESLKSFVKSLSNDKLAHQVLNALST